jgi:hypothetical protein
LRLWTFPPNPWGFREIRQQVTFWSWLASLSRSHEGSFWTSHSDSIRNSCILVDISLMSGCFGYWVARMFCNDGPESDYQDGPLGPTKDGRMTQQN